MVEEQSYDWASDLNNKLADIEEKHNLLRDRVLMADEGFLKNIDLIKKELSLLKDSIREVRRDIEGIKETSQSIIEDLNNFARKEELHVMERYMKLWEPLKFVKAEEVRKIINQELVKKEEKE